MKKTYFALLIIFVIGFALGAILFPTRNIRHKIQGKYFADHACVYLSPVRIGSPDNKTGMGYHISCVCRLKRASDGATSEWIDAVGVTLRAGVCWDTDGDCKETLARMESNISKDCEVICPATCDSMLRNVWFERNPDYEPTFND